MVSSINKGEEGRSSSTKLDNIELLIKTVLQIEL